jgi:nitroreductase
VQIPYSRWYSAIDNRRSRRRYNPAKTISDQVLTDLNNACAEFRPFPHARAELITEHCDEVFKGVVGAYGKIKCAQAFIAFIGDISDDHIQEKIGYIGEGIILEATALHLATCWVGGFFRSEIVASLVRMGANEKILSVTPVGYATELESLEEKIMTGFGWTHKRKPLSGLVTGLNESNWPGWIKSSIEAARKAPSAINRQPWHFHVEPAAITVSVRTSGPEFNVSKRLDCGIAMLHIEVASMNSGISGKWELLDSPFVARFIVT